MNQSGFGVLSLLFGGSETPVCGTWYFVEGELLPQNRQGKRRSVVVCRGGGEGGVVVYTRSSSRKRGFSHDAHSEHECGVTASHDVSLAKFSIHGCHVNRDGWIDLESPITLNVSVLDGRKMCLEDESSPLLERLDGMPA